MPNYTLNHVHHEAVDVHAAVDWYKKLFGATSDPPFERGGATWVPVHIGAVQITVTDREFAPMELGRYQGYDHIALVSKRDRDVGRARLSAVHDLSAPDNLQRLDRRRRFRRAS